MVKVAVGQNRRTCKAAVSPCARPSVEASVQSSSIDPTRWYIGSSSAEPPPCKQNDRRAGCLQNLQPACRTNDMSCVNLGGASPVSARVGLVPSATSEFEAFFRQGCAMMASGCRPCASISTDSSCVGLRAPHEGVLQADHLPRIARGRFRPQDALVLRPHAVLELLEQLAR